MDNEIGKIDEQQQNVDTNPSIYASEKIILLFHPFLRKENELEQTLKNRRKKNICNIFLEP